MRSTCEVIGRRSDGPILHIAFAGQYPPGSIGNPTARRMREFTAAAVSEHAPAAIIFDLLELEYRWGDAICSIAQPLLGEDGMLLPARILTKGDTAAALAPLLGPNWMLGIFGVRSSETLKSALHDLLRCDGRFPLA